MIDLIIFTIFLASGYHNILFSDPIIRQYSGPDRNSLLQQFYLMNEKCIWIFFLSALFLCAKYCYLYIFPYLTESCLFIFLFAGVTTFFISFCCAVLLCLGLRFLKGLGRDK